MKPMRQAGAIVAALLVNFAFANAQTSNNLLASPQIMTQISASDVAAMMGELGITTQVRPQSDGGAPVLLASTPGGGKFLFHFFNCENVAEAGKCSNTIVTTAFPSAGLSYEQLNDFNRKSVVTTGVNIDEQKIIILARNIVVIGGHSRDLFKGTVYLFLRDVQNFVNSKNSGATSVGFTPSPQKTSKITGVKAAGASAGSEEAFGLPDISAEVAGAISNTNDVGFAIDYDPGF